MPLHGCLTPLALGLIFLQARCVVGLQHAASPLVLSTDRSDDSSSHVQRKVLGSCPPEVDGIMYNHISKTAGTAVKELIRAVFTKSGQHPEEEIGPKYWDNQGWGEESTYVDTAWSDYMDAASGATTSKGKGGKGAAADSAPSHVGWTAPSGEQLQVVLQDDLTDKQVTEEESQHFFVVATVRRPCDYLVSTAVAGGYSNSTERFKQFVMDAVNDTYKKNPSHLMSKAITQRYGSSDNIHCACAVHNLKADFAKCMEKYEACGGVVSTTPTSEVIDGALKKAADGASSGGRSVGGDGTACNDMFDDEMMSAVLKTEQAVIDEFGLGTCCS